MCRALSHTSRRRSPDLPCGGDLSGHLNAGASAPAGQPADARRTPPVARSLSRSRPRRWCRPVGRRGDGRGDGRGGGRGGGRGVGLACSRAWGGRFGDITCAGSRVMRAMRASFGFGFGGSVTHGAVAAACHPKLASSCRRVTMSLLGGLGLARSRAGGRGASRSARAKCAVIRTDGRMMGVPCLTRARVVRARTRERTKTRRRGGRRGGASTGGRS